MFTLAAKDKIGKYLAKRIDEQFKSRREFCRKYLIAMDEKTDDNQIRNMSNRLSQILKGKKEIQLYDLPVFCLLLDISCEDILSAGKSYMPTSSHLTNYTVAFSKDEQTWDAYVERQGSPILNADEYGKTVIDYALEAENYDFLKYLMDNQYIQFEGADKHNCFTGFGAKTSIEKATFPYPQNFNALNPQLNMRDELRTSMVALAIKHTNIEMLERLHAREIPTLYQMSYYSSVPNDFQKYYNAKLMEELTHADDKTLEYFSEEFEITNWAGDTNKFLFPFMGELIERLLQIKNRFVEYMLKNAIQHNQYVYDQLAPLLAEAVRYYEQYDFYVSNDASKNELTKKILRDLSFYGDGSLVDYFAILPITKNVLRSNIVRVNMESSNPMINRRIMELNDLYDSIHNITPKFE